MSTRLPRLLTAPWLGGFQMPGTIDSGELAANTAPEEQGIPRSPRRWPTATDGIGQNVQVNDLRRSSSSYIWRGESGLCWALLPPGRARRTPAGRWCSHTSNRKGATCINNRRPPRIRLRSFVLAGLRDEGLERQSPNALAPSVAVQSRPRASRRLPARHRRRCPCACACACRSQDWSAQASS